MKKTLKNAIMNYSQKNLQKKSLDHNAQREILEELNKT